MIVELAFVPTSGVLLPPSMNYSELTHCCLYYHWNFHFAIHLTRESWCCGHFGWRGFLCLRYLCRRRKGLSSFKATFQVCSESYLYWRNRGLDCRHRLSYLYRAGLDYYLHEFHDYAFTFLGWWSFRNFVVESTPPEISTYIKLYASSILRWML